MGRCLPSFLLAGAQKSGSTVLAALLHMHPAVVMPARKEAHFFNRDRVYALGPEYYLRFFPIVPAPHTKVFGEATPVYLASPNACPRIAHTLPGAKLILLLRNPLARAYSEMQMKRRCQVSRSTSIPS